MVKLDSALPTLDRPNSLALATSRRMPTNLTPSFKHPPVIERVLGVHFAPIEKWGVPHLGLFWRGLRDEYPTFSVQPPIASVEEMRSRVVQLDLTGGADIRCWFVSEADDELIQLQRDRFLLNWRRRESCDYPRYSTRLRNTFVSRWAAFRQFLESEGMGEPHVIQCEVTYINHIPQGEGWEVAADWDKVFTICNPLKTESFLPSPESRQFALNYLMPEELGSLRASATRAMRASDGKVVIQFELSAKGRPKQLTGDAIVNWLDAAHAWVVRGFNDLTMPAMHERWGKE